MWPIETFVPSFSLTHDEALLAAMFCTDGIASSSDTASEKNISNKIVADTTLNNIFVTLRTAFVLIFGELALCLPLVSYK